MGSAAISKTTELEANVTKFQCTLFGESGFKTWEILGKQGTFKAETAEIHIEGLHLKIFDGHESPSLLITLESPEATILTQAHQAFGSSYVLIVSPQYTALGHGWTFERINPDSYKAHVKKDVRVIFKSKKTLYPSLS